MVTALEVQTRPALQSSGVLVPEDSRVQTLHSSPSLTVFAAIIPERVVDGAVSGAHSAKESSASVVRQPRKTLSPSMQSVMSAVLWGVGRR